MNSSHPSKSFRVPEGRKLQGSVPLEFERFYRSQLRFLPGRRIRSIELGSRYQAWALAHEAGSLSYRDIRRAMLAIGHRHIHSNGMLYLDVAFAEAALELADNYPPASQAHVIERIDAMAAELAAIRASFGSAINTMGAE